MIKINLLYRQMHHNLTYQNLWHLPVKDQHAGDQLSLEIIALQMIVECIVLTLVFLEVMHLPVKW